jgi:glucosamine--fructose-6-phosphate aminotransferase (isomerizing)
VALEGALKLKEIAYVHAEGYAAGELKHGPIAMIDPGMALVVLAPRDSWREKTVSNLEEVKARGGLILGVGEAADTGLRSLCDLWIPLPACLAGLDEELLPFFLIPVLQLLSYEIAVRKGTDVDKPRNLAKSVTVE